MPLVVKTLETQLAKIFETAAKKAFEATYDIDKKAIENLANKENLSSQDIKKMQDKQKELAAKAFGEAFKDESASDVAKAIDTYIKSITLVPVLVSPTGPVTGTIQVT